METISGRTRKKQVRGSEQVRGKGEKGVHVHKNLKQELNIHYKEYPNVIFRVITCSCLLRESEQKPN